MLTINFGLCDIFFFSLETYITINTLEQRSSNRGSQVNF